MKKLSESHLGALKENSVQDSIIDLYLQNMMNTGNFNKLLSSHLEALESVNNPINEDSNRMGNTGAQHGHTLIFTQPYFLDQNEVDMIDQNVHLPKTVKSSNNPMKY